MSVLLDVLAYNTYQNNFYTNMAFSEMFLDSATLENSVMSHAKTLNYLPHSTISAVAKITVTITSASTGNFSTGNYSTGNWSISHYSTGHFSTEDYSGYGAFDKPCTPEEWSNAEKPYFLYFNLTEWVESEEMTDEEKENNPSHKTTGGYLKVYEYQEAWKRSFDKQENKEEQIKLLESLPNFDYDKFVKISGIDYRKQDDAIAQAIELLKKNGYKIIKD
jgi:hypothetical protein